MAIATHTLITLTESSSKETGAAGVEDKPKRKSINLWYACLLQYVEMKKKVSKAKVATELDND